MCCLVTNRLCSESRTVPNDSVARPLLKGILDGPLLQVFEMLPLGRQAEMTRQIGSSRGVILRDLRVAFGISGGW
jgi:cleavage and polyadenylation specificity factor subunit 1